MNEHRTNPEGTHNIDTREGRANLNDEFHLVKLYVSLGETRQMAAITIGLITFRPKD